ncbi:universal stress protein [Caldimonas sp. KR1-144]|uniref:universal stress protein n=1 Tax=Caldimonas sp. KR1-144 TaxID=3400911 RepID=UPI003C11EA20
MKVLLAVDGSDYTKRMLAYLAAHDELLGPDTQYVAVTVVPPIPPHAANYLSKADLAGHYEDEAERVLAPVRQFTAQNGWNVEFLRRVGHAGDVVAQTANEGGFDLLVMGSHGHSAIGSLVIGSVTARVLAQCKTPMLIVR